MRQDWDQLIAKARTGDWRAEELLFTDSKRVLWAIYRTKNWQWGMPADDAESLMHLSIFNAMKKYPGGWFPAYLKTTFINAVFDEWIRKPRLESEPLFIPNDETGEERVRKEPAAPVDVGRELLTKEEWSIILDCMENLTSERKQGLQLWLDGWSYEAHCPARSGEEH